jgi:hypothetical protein
MIQLCYGLLEDYLVKVVKMSYQLLGPENKGYSLADSLIFQAYYFHQALVAPDYVLILFVYVLLDYDEIYLTS